MACSLSNTIVLVIHRKDTTILNISNSIHEDRRVHRIKAADEKKLLSVVMEFDIVTIVSILLVRFCAND